MVFSSIVAGNSQIQVILEQVLVLEIVGIELAVQPLLLLGFDPRHLGDAQQLVLLLLLHPLLLLPHPLHEGAAVLQLVRVVAAAALPRGPASVVGELLVPEGRSAGARDAPSA